MNTLLLLVSVGPGLGLSVMIGRRRPPWAGRIGSGIICALVPLILLTIMWAMSDSFYRWTGLVTVLWPSIALSFLFGFAKPAVLTVKPFGRKHRKLLDHSSQLLEKLRGAGDAQTIAVADAMQTFIATKEATLLADEPALQVVSLLNALDLEATLLLASRAEVSHYALALAAAEHGSRYEQHLLEPVSLEWHALQSIARRLSLLVAFAENAIEVLPSQPRGRELVSNYLRRAHEAINQSRTIEVTPLLPEHTRKLLANALIVAPPWELTA